MGRHLHSVDTPLVDIAASQADTHPWADTPRVDTPPSGQTNRPTLQDTVNKRVVRILLGCILVKSDITFNCVCQLIMLIGM